MSPTTYNPRGIDFYDQASGRTMKLVTGGELDGWLLYWHKHSKNWVTLRVATDDDRRVIRDACMASRMKMPHRMWDYGTRKPCKVIQVLAAAKVLPENQTWDTVLVTSEEDPPEGFVLFSAGDPLPAVGDVGEIVFTEGGPKGGYWKFEPGERSPADAIR